jgi:hypothetical protein
VLLELLHDGSTHPLDPGTARMLWEGYDLARDAHATVVFASPSSVYGDQDQ